MQNMRTLSLTPDPRDTTGHDSNPNIPLFLHIHILCVIYGSPPQCHSCLDPIQACAGELDFRHDMCWPDHCPMQKEGCELVSACLTPTVHEVRVFFFFSVFIVDPFSSFFPLSRWSTCVKYELQTELSLSSSGRRITSSCSPLID